MRLQSKLLVRQNIGQVINFFYEPSSLAKWDRSVTEMIPIPQSGDPGGEKFDTIAPSGMKMNYEVIELSEDGKNVKIKLHNSKMFKKATWHFQFKQIAERTEITCHVYFTLKWAYFFLYPILYLNKSALFRDLKFLETALEENYRTENK